MLMILISCSEGVDTATQKVKTKSKILASLESGTTVGGGRVLGTEEARNQARGIGRCRLLHKQANACVQQPDHQQLRCVPKDSPNALREA